MMKIAIAGGGGLARLFAQHIDQTAYTFIILSRYPRPDLESYGYQVHTVNYEDQEDLQFILRGINLVISTIPRHAQLKLIDAAAHAGVSRFVPSEFEGSLDRRPRDDPLDPGQYHKATMSRLRHWSKRGNRMKSTVVTCGVFYERFAPGGMESLDIGSSTNISSQGSYLMDVGYQQALIVEKGNQQIWLNMTSANDVAYFLVAALELGLENWLPEFKIRGDQLSIAEVVRWGEYISKDTPYMTSVIDSRDLQAEINAASHNFDLVRHARLLELQATEKKRYEYTPDSNELVYFQPTNFGAWLDVCWRQY